MRRLFPIHLLSFALKGSEAFVFVPPFREHRASCCDSRGGPKLAARSITCSRARHQNLRKCAPLTMMNAHAPGKNEDSFDDQDADSADASSDDASFYADLREAKNEKLGAPIPESYFAAGAAIDSENEFLSALKNARAEFAEAKKETGSVDGAVEKIMDGIRKEEELEAAWEKEQQQEEERQDQSRCSSGGGDDDDDRGRKGGDSQGADDAFQ